MNQKNKIVAVNFEDDRDGLDNKASVGLVPYDVSEEVSQSFNDFSQKIREILSIPPSDWPQGKTVTCSLEFQVVPKSIEVKIGRD